MTEQKVVLDENGNPAYKKLVLDADGNQMYKLVPISPKPENETLSASDRFLKGLGARLLGTENASLDPATRLKWEAPANSIVSPFTFGNEVVKGLMSDVGAQAESGNLAGVGGALTGELLGMVPGLATSGALKLLGKTKLPGWLASKAATQYGKVLSTTKEVPKAVAESKVIPGALERGITALTPTGLRRKVAGHVVRVSTELDQAWDALPPDATIKAQPIWDALQRAIDKTYIKGTQIVGNEPLKKALEKMQSKLVEAVQTGNDVISAESARSWRQMLDSDVADAKGFFVKGKKLSAEIKAKKIATDAIRRELGETYPNIKKINEEFSFYKNFLDVLEATGTRKVGQEGALSTKMAGIAGAAAGLSKGGLATAGIDAATMALAAKTFRGTGWRTVSAVTKNTLAKALADGDMARATLILTLVGFGVKPPASGRSH
jgi:hypothetical protein